MKSVIIISTLFSMLSAAPAEIEEAPQLNRRLLDGLFGGGFGGGAPAGGYPGYFGNPGRPLASVNLKDLWVLSPKSKSTMIDISEGAYNSYGYNPYAFGSGPVPGPVPYNGANGQQQQGFPQQQGSPQQQ